MSNYLTIMAQSKGDILERIMRVTRHRGFKAEFFKMQHQPDTKLMQIEMTVSSIRPVQLLSRQLEKLIDVKSVLVHADKCVEK